jgi:hypothetical protein
MKAVVYQLRRQAPGGFDAVVDATGAARLASLSQTHCFERALRLLGSGRVRTDGIVTHVLGLAEYGRALTLLRDEPSCLKATLAP